MKGPGGVMLGEHGQVLALACALRDGAGRMGSGDSAASAQVVNAPAGTCASSVLRSGRRTASCFPWRIS
jgi:hypothetical protein